MICEISEERLKTLIRAIAILIVKILWFWLAGVEESAMTKKVPELLKQNLCLTGKNGCWLAGAKKLAVIKRSLW